MTVDEMKLIITVVGTGASVAAFLFVVLRGMRKELAGDIRELRNSVTDVRERVSALEGRIQVVSQLVMRSESE